MQIDGEIDAKIPEQVVNESKKHYRYAKQMFYDATQAHEDLQKQYFAKLKLLRSQKNTLNHLETEVSALRVNQTLDFGTDYPDPEYDQTVTDLLDPLEAEIQQRKLNGHLLEKEVKYL